MQLENGMRNECRRFTTYIIPYADRRQIISLFSFADHCVVCVVSDFGKSYQKCSSWIFFRSLPIFNLSTSLRIAFIRSSQFIKRLNIKIVLRWTNPTGEHDWFWGVDLMNRYVRFSGFEYYSGRSANRKITMQ